MHPKPPVTFVFFDAAYTLIKPRQSVGTTYSAVAKTFGLALEGKDLDRKFREEFKRAPPLCFPGSSAEARSELEFNWWKTLVAKIVEKSSFQNPQTFDAYFRAVFSFFATKEAWTLCDGTLKILETLQVQRIPMAIISNFDSRLHRILEEMNIRHFFSQIFISSEVGFAKPDLRIFQHALQITGVKDPENAVYLGDDVDLDYSPAIKVGMRAFSCGTPTFKAKDFLAHIGFISND